MWSVTFLSFHDIIVLVLSTSMFFWKMTVFPKWQHAFAGHRNILQEPVLPKGTPYFHHILLLIPIVTLESLS